MKHTKNILKSLLITVMALSLLSVSCSKDEGGSKPTNPTSITINAETLDGAIRLAAGQLAIDSRLKDKVTFNFGAFTSNSGAGSADATVTTTVAESDLKAALEDAFALKGASFSSTATLAKVDTSNKKVAKLTITITVSGNNTFASDVKSKYKEVAVGKVETVITITAAKDIIS